MRICICGGGNLGHVVAGFLASQSDNHVSVLTRRPENWANILEVIDPDGKVYNGSIYPTDNVALAMADADLVFICLPGYAIHDELVKISPYLKSDAKVGTVVSSTGFFFEAFKVLPNHIGLFGFQRVPFICRTIEYGHKAELKGYKSSLSMSVEQVDDKESLRIMIENLFKTPTKLLRSYYEVSLSNSNPLLHTSRLYTMFKNWEKGVVYDRNPQFYSEWTIDASELYIQMDNELQELLKVLPVDKGSIPPVLEYYESHDAESLTDKLNTIPAFKGIYSPMKKVEGGYVPDFNSRYFTEDIPYGMRFIIETAEKYQISIPTIDKVYKWGLSKIESSSK